MFYKEAFQENAKQLYAKRLQMQLVFFKCRNLQAVYTFELLGFGTLFCTLRNITRTVFLHLLTNPSIRYPGLLSALPTYHGNL